MWSHRRGRRRGFEAALRSHRSEPREEYVRSLSGRLREQHVAPRVAWSRLAFAGAASTLILGMFASFGGFGYAASGATSTYQVVKQVVVNHKVSVSVHKSSAAAQYPPKPHHAPAGTAAGHAPSAAAAVAGESKTLPFTGFSLAATVAISLAMILVGLALRRRERKN